MNDTNTGDGGLVAELLIEEDRCRSWLDYESTIRADTFSIAIKMVSPYEQKWQADRARWQAQQEQLQTLVEYLNKKMYDESLNISYVGGLYDAAKHLAAILAASDAGAQDTTTPTAEESAP